MRFERRVLKDSPKDFVQVTEKMELSSAGRQEEDYRRKSGEERARARDLFLLFTTSRTLTK